MSATDEILSALPFDQIAAAVGASPDQVEAAAKAAVPALLGGIEANAQHAGGAASLADALGQHDGSLLDALGSGAGINDVDTAEGAKIASHVFGGAEDDVVQRLGALSAKGGAGGAGGAGAIGSDLVKKLIPIIAPIVMSYLAKQLSGKGAAAGSAAGSGGSGAGGNVLGDVLSQVLTGAAQGASGGSAGGGALGGVLGDVLGGLLGGGRKK